MAKLSALDTDGFLLSEKEEEEEWQENEEDKAQVLKDLLMLFVITSYCIQGHDPRSVSLRENLQPLQDGWSSLKDETQNDATSDEQYDPDTVYGGLKCFTCILLPQ